VLLRYVFLHPIFWADELARYLMVWMIFLGAGKVAGNEGHVSVTILADRFPGMTAASGIQRSPSCACSSAWFSPGTA
jgi:TRAP-type C4-dicarboxylate transport system permease small subunit